MNGNGHEGAAPARPPLPADGTFRTTVGGAQHWRLTSGDLSFSGTYASCEFRRREGAAGLLDRLLRRRPVRVLHGVQGSGPRVAAGTLLQVEHGGGTEYVLVVAG